MMILKKIHPLSFAKVTAIMGAIIGFIAGLIFILIMLVLGSILAAFAPSLVGSDSFELPSEPSQDFSITDDSGLFDSSSNNAISDYSDTSSGAGIMPMFPTEPKWSNLILFPIIYSIFFFLGGLIFAWLYNLIEKLFGGVKLDLEFEQIKENKIPQAQPVQQQAYQQQVQQNYAQQVKQQTYRQPVPNNQQPQRQFKQ